MDITYIILFLVGGGVLLIAVIGISYWAVNLFIKQLTERSLQQFREELAKETEQALKHFKDGMAEQIVNQENKSDSMAKLYGILIDLLRVGKEFNTSLGKGDVQQAERMLVGIRNTSASFGEVYQKQRLHLPEEICAIIDPFLVEQKGVVDQLEVTWRMSRKDSAESKSIESGMKQAWLHFEDRIGEIMESMRVEFRKRQPSSANVLMKWLNQTPASHEVPQPPAQ